MFADLNEKVALITGGGSGVGRLTALEMAKDFTIVVAGRREDALAETIQLVEQAGGAGLGVPTDVGCTESVGKLFDTIKEKYGRLDFLFNNAGISVKATPLEDLTLEDWQQTIDTNVTGVFLCTQQAIRIMKEQDPQGGRIVNNGSVSAQVPRPNAAPYTAAKHAVTGLTKSTSLDGRKYNIACGQIDIGNALTDMSHRLQHGVLQANGTTEAEPMMDAKDIARSVAFMASLPPEANVQTITVMATNMPLVGRG